MHKTTNFSPVYRYNVNGVRNLRKLLFLYFLFNLLIIVSFSPKGGIALNVTAGKELTNLSGITPSYGAISSVKLYWSNTSGVKGSLLTTLTTSQGQSWTYQHTGLTVGLDYYYTAEYVDGLGGVVSTDPQVMASPWLDDSSNLVIPFLIKDVNQIPDSEFDEIVSLIRIRPNIRINWIDLAKPGPYSAHKLTKIKEFVTAGDDVAYGPYVGMGFSDGGGVPVHTKQQTYDDIAAGYSQWNVQLGKNPYTFAWYSHRELLSHIAQTYGQKIIIASDWQAYKCDSNSMMGGFNQPYYPSKNHHIVPARDMANAIDIVNVETEASDLYWSKIQGNRPSSTAFQAMDLNALIKTYRGALDLSNWDKSKKKYFFSVSEMGYIYLVTSGKTIAQNIQLFKDWAKWVVRAYPNASFPSLTELNTMFRAEHPSNDGLRVDYQIGAGAYWSNVNFPARDDTNKVIMGWNKNYRFRFKVKEGAGGYVRLTDLLLHDDTLTPPQPDTTYDQSVYSGMAHLELDNIGLAEEWTFSNGSTLFVNRSGGTITGNYTLSSINQTGNTFAFTVQIRNNTDNSLVLTKDYTVTPGKIEVKNTIGAGYTPTKLEFEDYKRTTDATFVDSNGNPLTLVGGTYTPGNANFPTKTKTGIFELNLINTMGTVSQAVVTQGAGTFNNWAGSGQGDDTFIPANFSSVKRVINNPANTGLLGYSIATLDPIIATPVVSRAANSLTISSVIQDLQTGETPIFQYRNQGSTAWTDLPSATMTSGTLVNGTWQSTLSQLPIKTTEYRVKVTRGTTDYFSTVANFQVSAIAISPAVAFSLYNGQSRILTVIITYQDNSTLDITSQATWSTSNQAVATVMVGSVTGIGPGQATITASNGSLSSTVQVVVENIGALAGNPVVMGGFAYGSKPFTASPLSGSDRIREIIETQYEIVYQYSIKEQINTEYTIVSDYSIKIPVNTTYEVINEHSIKFPINTTYDILGTTSIAPDSKALTFTGTLATGDELVIDMKAMTAKLNGTNVLHLINGAFFALLPGTNQIKYQDGETVRTITIEVQKRTKFL